MSLRRWTERLFLRWGLEERRRERSEKGGGKEKEPEARTFVRTRIRSIVALISGHEMHSFSVFVPFLESHDYVPVRGLFITTCVIDVCNRIVCKPVLDFLPLPLTRVHSTSSFLSPAYTSNTSCLLSLQVTKLAQKIFLGTDREVPVKSNSGEERKTKGRNPQLTGNDCDSPKVALPLKLWTTIILKRN